LRRLRPQAISHRVQAPNGRIRFLEQDVPCLRQLKFATATFKQFDSELFLEFLDLVAYRRCGNEQFLGGDAETAVPRGDAECAHASH
jgi:hypothetical protein